VVVGDVMADACFRLAPIARERSTVLTRLGLEPGTYVVATIHREANVVEDERLRQIVYGLNWIEEPVVFPVHPRTRKRMAEIGVSPGKWVSTTEPLGYVDMAALTSQAHAVVTDSGGLQKEAYWYGVPCVTVRDSTEWVDTVEVGANVLVPAERAAIAAAVADARMPDERPPLYGDGHASERIAAALLLPA
jgi:UDP-N-acetylglucosamine 2-epimerase